MLLKNENKPKMIVDIDEEQDDDSLYVKSR